MKLSLHFNPVTALLKNGLKNILKILLKNLLKKKEHWAHYGDMSPIDETTTFSLFPTKLYPRYLKSISAEKKGDERKTMVKFNILSILEQWY